MNNKTKILYWGDAPAPIIHTGFGIVAKHILRALHNTGLYEIDVLGINYFGSFYDKEETPYHIVPARLLNPNDPYGSKMLIRSLQQKQYDILFILNDIYVTHDIAKEIEAYRAQYNQNLKIIYYYPVDCVVRKDFSGMISLADKPVTYTEFGREQTTMALGSLSVAKKLEVIYHGTDSESYFPLSVSKILEARERYFLVGQNDNTFIWTSINRNSVRKNLPQTIYAFAEFKKRNPQIRTMLYLHTVPNENGIDLSVCLKQLDLSTRTDVIFPLKYSPVEAIPNENLNELYNAADCFISTSLGEGWGIGQCEAMAAGIPVLLPWNTSTPEIIGQDFSRGFHYLCNEKYYVDSSGYRNGGRLEDIVSAMQVVYNESSSRKITKLQAARKFTITNSWDKITPRWVDLFSKVQSNIVSNIDSEVI